MLLYGQLTLTTNGITTSCRRHVEWRTRQTGSSLEFQPLITSNVTPLRPPANIYPRADHPISRKFISDAALKVLYRLDKAGFKAYLVGGSVRDLLLGREPKDFDIATEALPEQVRELFRNCRLIGRRFRLAHVRFGEEIVEVATFRAGHDGDTDGAAISDEGRILRDNVYGGIEDDVWRRDFTVNALYYNIADFSIVDYTGGYEDLKAGRLRLIGDPERRYREDPVRMLRAIRFAVKLGFSIDATTSEPFQRLNQLLEEIAPARLFDEVLKLFHGGVGHQTFEALRHHGLLRHLFPLTEAALAGEDEGYARLLTAQALQNTDSRIAEGKPVNPAFLFAALLWHSLQEQMRRLEATGVASVDAAQLAADSVISKQVARIAVPRRFTNAAREIWALQPRLVRRMTKRIPSLLEHPRFRAAYDFLLLRAQAGEDVAEAAGWWTDYLEANDDGKAQLTQALRGESKRTPRRGRRRKRPRSTRD